MGEIREEVESFYMRDYVEEKVTIIVIIQIFISKPTVLIMIISKISISEPSDPHNEHLHPDDLLQVETRLIEQLSLSDLV